MSEDPLKVVSDFLESLPRPAYLRFQSFQLKGDRPGWWLRVAEYGKEDDPKALMFGPFETREEARGLVGIFQDVTRGQMLSFGPLKTADG